MSVPIRKETAIPSEPVKDANAVAVVRWLGGNHSDERTGGPACVTGPARPLKN